MNYNGALIFSTKHPVSRPRGLLFLGQRFRPILCKMSKYETQLFINGNFVNSLSGKTFPVVNPATEEEICQVQEALSEDVDLAVKAATDAFEVWRKLSGPTRRDYINKLADLIEKNKAELAALETLNNGKPETQKNGAYADDRISTEIVYSNTFSFLATRT